MARRPVSGIEPWIAIQDCLKLVAFGVFQ